MAAVGVLSRSEMTVMVGAKLEGRGTPAEIRKIVDNIFSHLDKDHSNAIEFEGTHLRPLPSRRPVPRHAMPRHHRAITPSPD
jgi:hypothetical protein